jgi:hypothetical protein
MRTTLSIDDDVLLAVKERARRENRTAGAVLSDLARQALTNQSAQPMADEPDAFYGFEPLPHRGETISNALIDRLRGDEAV